MTQADGREVPGPDGASDALSHNPKIFRLALTQLSINRVSDNVGSVKWFSSTLQHALEEERHFALVDGLLFANQGSLVIRFRSGPSVRPMHLFGLELRS